MFNIKTDRATNAVLPWRRLYGLDACSTPFHLDSDVTAEFATSLNVLTLLLLFFEFEPVLYDGVAVVEHGRNGVVALAPNSTEGCERARLAGPASSMASIEENVFGPRRRRRPCYRRTLRAPSAHSVEDWRESPGFRATVQCLFYSATLCLILMVICRYLCRNGHRKFSRTIVSSQ